MPRGILFCAAVIGAANASCGAASPQGSPEAPSAGDQRTQGLVIDESKAVKLSLDVPGADDEAALRAIAAMPMSWSADQTSSHQTAASLGAGLTTPTPQIGAYNAPDVPEIAVPGLPDIAMVTMRNGGVVILFNPATCMQLGIACLFFKAHEYGHVGLNHLLNGTFPRQAEAEADCWAGLYGDPPAIEAALRLFLAGQGGSPSHGSPQERYNTVRACVQRRAGAG